MGGVGARDGGHSRKNKRREIAVGECSQLFREELQGKGVHIRPGEHEDWRDFFYLISLFFSIY